jgi:hypothetical protein
MLAGFNGSGMTLIMKSAEAVARMIREGKEFEDVAKEVGVPALFGTSEERMRRKVEEPLDGHLSIQVNYIEWDAETA